MENEENPNRTKKVYKKDKFAGILKVLENNNR